MVQCTFGYRDLIEILTLWSAVRIEKYNSHLTTSIVNNIIYSMHRKNYCKPGNDYI